MASLINDLLHHNSRAQKVAGAGLLLLTAPLFAGCPGGSGGAVLECGGGPEFKCPPGMYCMLGPECGGIDHRGVCKPIPQDCPREDKPVCGCDGATFESACYAAASGVTVDYDGPCISKENQGEE